MFLCQAVDQKSYLYFIHPSFRNSSSSTGNIIVIMPQVNWTLHDANIRNIQIYIMYNIGNLSGFIWCVVTWALWIIILQEVFHNVNINYVKLPQGQENQNAPNEFSCKDLFLQKFKWKCREIFPSNPKSANLGSKRPKPLDIVLVSIFCSQKLKSDQLFYGA